MSDKRTPVDPAVLLLPVKSIVLAGDVFAWDEANDPAWAGEWAFPAKGWDDHSRESWVAMNGTLIGATIKHDAVIAAGEALVTSPAYLLTMLDADIAEKKRQVEIDGRRVEGLKAWASARKQYGVNMRAIQCVTGDVVIMVGMTAAESDHANARATMARETRLKADPNAASAAWLEYLSEQRNWMLGKCVHPVGPQGDRSRIREIAEAHPGLWDDLTLARNDMARARVEDEGKGFAP